MWTLVILKDTSYEIELEKWKVKEFEEKVLFSGLCDFIIPMSFSDMNDRKKIKYNCSGYSSVRDMDISSINGIFEIIEKTLITLSKSIEFYIPHEKVSLNIDTVFYDKKRKRVRIAYMPDEKGTLLEHLNFFLDQLADLADDDGVEYICSLKKDLNMNNRNLRDMAVFVSEQKKRINKCGVL